MTDTTVTPNSDKRDLMTFALLKMRDVVDAWPDLSTQQRNEAVTAAASFLQDLRAAGVIR